MQYQSFLSIVAAAAAIGYGSSLHAAVVYSDSFTVNNAGGDTARDPGDPLAGTTTEVGGGTWATSGDIFLGQVGATTDGNVYSTNVSSATQYAALPVSLNPGDIITLDARIKPFNSTGSDNWIAIGFTDAEGSVLYNGTTWLIVRQDTDRADEIVMLGNAGGTGASNKLSNTATPGLPDADGYTVVQLTYDSGANTVSLDVNGETLLSDAANLGASPPVITHVAFQPFRNTVEGNLDDWLVTVTPAVPALDGDINGDGFVGIEDLNIVLGNWNAGTPPATGTPTIPEPGSLALVALSGLTLVGRRRG